MFPFYEIADGADPDGGGLVVLLTGTDKREYGKYPGDY